jgi:DNA sulfur modification protein DndD
MILQKIELDNYGVFRGKHVFNLTPDLHNKRPIILFGGLNGSGKTTLFEGIKLCLYGRKSFKGLRSRKAYQSYLKKRIKPLNPQRGRKYHSAIELNVEFNDFGVKDTYSVRRNWKVEGENVEEQFRVLKNGQMLGTIEQEYSQVFIANLIPIGIANLFFFDGEKIQELAEDTSNDGFLKEGIDSILGLDIIQTLANDLRIYAIKQNTAVDGVELINEMENFSKHKTSQEGELQDLYQERSSIRIKLEKTIDIIANKENELSLQGAGYAKKRNEFKNKLGQIENELTDVRKKMKEIYSGLFPFILVPDLCLQLRDIIQEESARKNQSSTIKLIEQKKDIFTSRLFQNNSYLSQISRGTSKEEIVNDIISTFRDVIKEAENEDYHFINDFSEKELDKLLYWVDQTSSTIPREIKFQMASYSRLISDSAYYENLLRRVPEDSILDPIINEINQQYEMKGRYENQLNKVDEEVGSLKYKISETERQLNLLEEKFEQYNKFERKIRLIRKIRRMLGEYQHNIREDKMEMLRNTFLDSVSMILRKHNFINDIIIDSNTYQIQLKLEDGNYIDKSILSKGEKQIYAISMLLALAEVSGRPLPFVIDTPLARLDSVHRDNIVENFFPNASHQVIIFSTDTEIDKIYFEKLSSHITRVYHLQYDNQTSSSVGKEVSFSRAMEVTVD